MSKNIGYTVLLNDHCLFSSAHGDVYAPLHINERVMTSTQQAIASQKPSDDSCVKTMTSVCQAGKFIISAVHKPLVKCSCGLVLPSESMITETCFRKLCNGKCSDPFMQNVIARNILPELYPEKQK